MKLLIITAIAAFDQDIKKMLKQAEVKNFSYKDVTGFKDISEVSMEGNWFGSEMSQNESILYYAFIDNQNVDTLIEKVNEFNTQQESLSNIHVAVLNIEKYN